MTDTGSAAEIAERVSQRRSRVLWLQAILFIAWQGSFFGWGAPMVEPLRTVDHVKMSAWLVWSAALLLLLATGGGWFRSKEVRRLLNDEVTRAHRAEAQQWGFWFAIPTTIGLSVVSQMAVVTTAEALHAILTLGVGAAILRFAVLERRAERA